MGESDLDNSMKPATTLTAGTKETTKPRLPIVTTEHSIEAINDVLKELEDDDPPTQTQDSPIQSTNSNTKPDFYRHRFAIYCRSNIGFIGTTPSTQLNLFKSFCKCIKSVDNSSQIPPIQSDINIHPTTTTDQVNNIEPVGIVNYFKPYKRTNKMLSGDFHIGTKLSFEDLKSNKTLQTWFHNHGYGIILNGCQSADRVRIGFLSWVRTFSYRDGLQKYIVNTREWQKKQFHFRLYFDSFSTGIKGKSTHVLMIDVDRPSMEVALHFFHCISSRHISMANIPTPQITSTYYSYLCIRNRTQKKNVRKSLTTTTTTPTTSV